MRPFYLGGIGLSRIFQNKQGSEPQAVRVHFRNPNDYDGPITAKVSHWVLQVGKYFYELAEPAEYVVERAIAEQNTERVKNEGRSEIGNEETNEQDGINENDENSEDGEDERDSYRNRTNLTYVYEGKTGVSLQIRKGVNHLDMLKSQTFELDTTRLKSSKVRERAIHIFEKVFRDKHDFWHFNSQAFLCYLAYSIRHVNGDITFIGNHKPWYQERNVYASHCNYRLWKLIVGESIERSSSHPWKRWSLSERHINYDEIIPPGKWKRRGLNLGNHPSSRNNHH